MIDWITIAVQKQEDNEEWTIEYSPSCGMYRCSKFKDNHFCEDIIFDEYDKSDDRK